VTIHSFFLLPPAIIQQGDIKTAPIRQLYTKLELLIIDEVSMVRPDLIDGIDMFLRKNRSSEEPFGGVQVLLIGDMYQLPPVVTEDEGPVLRTMGYATDFFFGAKSLSEMEMLPVFLERVFRQADPAFISILNDLREGERVSQALRVINERCVAGIADETIENNVVLTCTNVVADARNRAELSSLPTNMKTYTGSIKGEFKLAKDRLPAPMELELKLNAQVMFTKNDATKRWVNGTIGRVIELKSDQICVEINESKVEDQVWVSPERWEKYKYEYDANEERIVKTSVGEYSQFPLMLAWAVTIYKAQGKTLDNVLIDLGSGAFAAGQVYVGLSRVRSLENLRLVRPVHETEVKCDYEIARFYQQLVEMAHIGDDEELPAIRSTTINHRQTYNLRTHCEKLGKLSTDFQSLVDFLDQMHDACPSTPFLTGPRASSIHAGPQPRYDDSTNHGRSKYTRAGLQQNAGRFQERHEQVQVHMLEHDDTTVAMEVPLWLEFDQAGVFQSIMSPGECLSGHVDVISIENNKIWIWDYKPNALKERWAHVQLSIYALMLSQRTQIPLDRIRCGYFDDERCLTFSPRQQHIDLFDFYSYVPSGQSRQKLLKKKPTRNAMSTIIFDSNGYRIV
jgi:hypothetical protein